jgi:hypothetical protein
MLPTVKLNDQAFLEAHKVDNIGTQRLLATKLISVNLAQTKVAP